MKIKFKSVIISLIAIMLLVSFAAMAACSKEEDATSWNISSGGSVTAQLSDNGKYGYILTVSGSGATKDFESEKDTPWYGKSGRITDIIISIGITEIGKNSFNQCAAKTVVLPESVEKIKENSFSSSIQICAYADMSKPENVKVYLYSESRPDGEGDYWRMKNGTATVWETTKILFIGNSFTYYNDIPKLVERIALSANESVEVSSITRGAWTLSKFADSTDEYGRQVDKALSGASDFDVVVLQEQSVRPLTNFESFLSAVKSLNEKIQRTQDDCKVYLYSTWGYAREAESRNWTIPKMQTEIAAAYEKAASEIGADISCVGAAFTKVYNDYKDINLYFAEDNMHPSYEGSYLSAAVHTATIFGCDVRTASFVGELDGTTAQILKDVAYQTVFGS